ncbi:hypothetical protein ACQEVS_28475 [Streptomyces sp. CA-181903]|uniref:hypothetical protein n=1 Tax=Streptomyces sp. CA-181903 TaxID=3240055 RepID=UPI003D91D4BD
MDTRDRGIRCGTVTAAPPAVGRRGRQAGAEQGAEGRAGSPDGAGALRIAELEREIQELQRANETLKQYVSKALDLGTLSPGHGTTPPRTPAGRAARPWPARRRTPCRTPRCGSGCSARSRRPSAAGGWTSARPSSVRHSSCW